MKGPEQIDIALSETIQKNINNSCAIGITTLGEVVSINILNPQDPIAILNLRDHETARWRLGNKCLTDPSVGITATIINIHQEPDLARRSLFKEHRISIRAQDKETLRQITQEVWAQVSEQDNVIIEALLEKGDLESMPYELCGETILRDKLVPFSELLV